MFFGGSADMRNIVEKVWCSGVPGGKKKINIRSKNKKEKWEKREKEGKVRTKNTCDNVS